MRALRAPVLCVLVPVLALAGPVGPAAAQQGAPRFDRVTVEDGLAGPEVEVIHQDDQGFLWFSTSEGLERYDGYTFKVYKHDGRFWVGTLGGLNVLDRRTGKAVRYPVRPQGPPALAEAEISAGLGEGSTFCLSLPVAR